MSKKKKCVHNQLIGRRCCARYIVSDYRSGYEIASSVEALNTHNQLIGRSFCII